MQQQRTILTMIVFASTAALASTATMTLKPSVGDAQTPGMDWQAGIRANGTNTQNHVSQNQPVGTIGNGVLMRGLISFDLDDSIDPSDIISATLNVRLKGKNPNIIDSVSVYHSESVAWSDIDNPTKRTTMFNDGTFVDTGENLVDPNSAPGQFYSVSVTDEIIEDVTNDVDAFSVFRLQLNNASTTADLAPGIAYTFDAAEAATFETSPGVTNPQWVPFLEITLVPEPSAALLLTLAAASFLRRR